MFHLTGSVVGSKGNIGQTIYSASKAGIEGFTKSLAKEIASKGITANVIAPGSTYEFCVNKAAETVTPRTLNHSNQLSLC